MFLITKPASRSSPAPRIHDSSCLTVWTSNLFPIAPTSLPARSISAVYCSEASMPTSPLRISEPKTCRADNSRTSPIFKTTPQYLTRNAQDGLDSETRPRESFALSSSRQRIFNLHKQEGRRRPNHPNRTLRQLGNGYRKRCWRLHFPFPGLDCGCFPCSDRSCLGLHDSSYGVLVS